MNKNNRSLIACCLVILLIIAASASIMTGCGNSPTSRQSGQPVPSGEKIAQYNNSNAVISASELYDMLQDPNLVILDTRCASAKATKEVLQNGHIPGALFAIRSRYQDPVRWNSVGSPKTAQMFLGGLGIDKHSKIVIYGNDNGLQGRLYWMLKMHGAGNDVKILDGGIEKWVEAGYPVNSESIKPAKAKFEFNPVKADPNQKIIQKDMCDVVAAKNPNNIIVDARSSSEYLTMHIPSSVNVSVDELLNADKTFKTARELSAIFAAKGVTPDKNVYVYSNIGSRSSLAWYVLHELLGYSNVRNYDGGFKDWRARERAVERGEQKAV